MSNAYQLTKYAVGSKREFWAMTWPLMLGLISSTLMLFVDRLFLAHFDPLALNAAASAGIAYYMFLVVPMGIAAISEVLVGRLHGKEENSAIGSATWQMIWFSLMLFPLFFLINQTVPNLIFMGSDNFSYESTYFQTLIFFAPVQCIMIALSGFFIGIGNVKIITVATLLGNFANIIFDYVFIFGWGPIPSWGIAGAALGTGLSQLLQITLLFVFFWSSYNRKTYRTHKFTFEWNYLYEGLVIGIPSGFGHCVEIIAHFLFFRIISSINSEQMTLVAMVQSFYILTSFIIEAQSKAASGIVANLLGAKIFTPLAKVLRSSFTLHSFFFAIFLVNLWLFPSFFYQLFGSPAHQELMADPILAQTFLNAMFFMALFFLLDGFCWILIGFLTSAGDTKYIFYVSCFVHWVAYVIPAYWLIGKGHGGADVAWSIIAGMSLLNFLFYLSRYLSGKWLKIDQPALIGLNT